MVEFNIYCDESNHLQTGPSPMVLGAVYCPKEKVKTANQRIREIKTKHGLSNSFEIKWTKVSPGKVQFYLDLVDYFFDNNDLHFRGILIKDKDALDHKKFHQTHDQWYYKMYFDLISKILEPENKYFIYLDEKDTQGGQKIKKLREVLCNNMYDFEREIIERIQEVKSYEVGILQITDLLVGALQFTNRSLESSAKNEIATRIKTRSSYELNKSTLLKEDKLNIFYWSPQE